MGVGDIPAPGLLPCRSLLVQLSEDGVTTTHISFSLSPHSFFLGGGAGGEVKWGSKPFQRKKEVFPA